MRFYKILKFFQDFIELKYTAISLFFIVKMDSEILKRMGGKDHFSESMIFWAKFCVSSSSIDVALKLLSPSTPDIIW